LVAYQDGFRRATQLAARPDVRHWGLDLSALLLAPTEGFGRYAPGALQRVAEAGADQERVGFEVSLQLAEGQIETGATLQESLVEEWQHLPEDAAALGGVKGPQEGETSGDRDIIAVPAAGLIQLIPQRIERFFILQEAEVMAIASKFASAPDLDPIAVVASARRSRQQQEFGRRYVACNTEARLRGRPIFQLSDKVNAFMVELGHIDASTEQGLGVLIDGIYFSMYESSGKSQMRNLYDYVPGEACEVVRRVSRLRNRLLRHVAEVEPIEVQKRQNTETLADLRAFGLDGFPRNPVERLQLHDQLMEQCLVLLDRLHDAVRRGISA
jgi:hypothetical protein